MGGIWFGSETCRAPGCEARFGLQTVRSLGGRAVTERNDPSFQSLVSGGDSGVGSPPARSRRGWRRQVDHIPGTGPRHQFRAWIGSGQRTGTSPELRLLLQVPPRGHRALAVYAQALCGIMLWIYPIGLAAMGSTKNRRPWAASLVEYGPVSFKRESGKGCR